jgi:rod shape-determining protein MreD
MKWRERNFDKWAAYGLLLIALFIFQSTLGDILAISRIKPNLLICALVALAMLEGEMAGGIFGMVSGFLIDTLLSHISGFYMLAGMVFGVAIGLAAKLYINVTVLSTMFVSGGVCFLYNILIFYTHYFAGGEASILSVLAGNILPEVIYTTILTIPFYYLILKLKDLTTVKEDEEVV